MSKELETTKKTEETSVNSNEKKENKSVGKKILKVAGYTLGAAAILGTGILIGKNYSKIISKIPLFGKKEEEKKPDPSPIITAMIRSCSPSPRTSYFDDNRSNRIYYSDNTRGEKKKVANYYDAFPRHNR